MDKLWLMLFDGSRRWAEHRLLDRIRAAYGDEQDPKARKMSLLLDDYIQIERRIREFVADDGCVIHDAVTIQCAHRSH